MHSKQHVKQQSIANDMFSDSYVAIKSHISYMFELSSPKHVLNLPHTNQHGWAGQSNFIEHSSYIYQGFQTKQTNKKHHTPKSPTPLYLV